MSEFISKGSFVRSYLPCHETCHER
jgi:hypothetical protein